ncbi:ESCRT-III subunit protein snf7 [Nowakowskiella sp. JEL0407]|nr:ESCRT-III subunit protein snf7 [Nowakowskiella sp. JEL0407]
MFTLKPTTQSKHSSQHSTPSLIREKVDLLSSRQSDLEQKIQKEHDFAKLNASKNKRAALLALKKKKMYENQVLKIIETKLTLETVAGNIDDARFNNHTLNVLKMGADSLREIHGTVNLNVVDDVMDSVQDQVDFSNEIEDIIARPMIGQDIDEFELEDELQAIEQQYPPSSISELEKDSIDLKKRSINLSEVPLIALPPRPYRSKQENKLMNLDDDDDDDDDEDLQRIRLAMAL